MEVCGVLFRLLCVCARYVILETKQNSAVIRWKRQKLSQWKHHKHCLGLLLHAIITLAFYYQYQCNWLPGKIRLRN